MKSGKTFPRKGMAEKVKAWVCKARQDQESWAVVRLIMRSFLKEEEGRWLISRGKF